MIRYQLRYDRKLDKFTPQWGRFVGVDCISSFGWVDLTPPVEESSTALKSIKEHKQRAIDERFVYEDVI